MVDRALAHAKISVIWNTVVEAVLGDEQVTGLTLRDVETGQTSTLATDALFIAIGHDPNTAIFAGQIDLDAQGYIVSPDGVSTNIPGVFVAGDVFDIRYKQAITAAGSGCKAALEAEKYLEALPAADALTV
jgi:thioredoxin reductase (NADPH)